MAFKKGNTYGKGRPVGSQNKLSIANKEFLHKVLFDQEQFLIDWSELDLNGRMELRTRLAPYIFPKQTQDSMSKFGEEPLFLDDPPFKVLYQNLGLETPNEPDEYFTFNNLLKDMREASPLNDAVELINEINEQHNRI